ncbi:Dyp-type peroxidase [Pasteurellaceae bacterium 20609_3]|uniref:Dyp-type peroxidase n=1 Tax=Spirabiliibacterium mucosae TaxID=28156 RepID=UPI001AAD4FE7|nr:Dyp-type peroxidase [Spirabiliibacterium mucosae]MBE2897386.1 Dyp-type peroxidase [Spirabiliibacterium mucosae]
MAATPQNVLDNPNNNTVFMVWNFHASADVQPHFQRLCSLVLNLNHSLDTRFPHTQASVVLGIGFEAWALLDLPQPLPKQFEKFVEIKGQKHTAVSTRGDLHLHIRTQEPSLSIDLATQISDVLNPVAECVEEVHGFRYWDGRSILGFVDGTENPQGEARAFFGLIGEEDPAYQGGSYLFVQKYLHDMRAWRALSVSEQECVIGRSKADDIEMSDEEKPSNAHSALANVGDDLKVVRDNMPFGNTANNEMGTYFICYASSFDTVKKMLTNMFIGDPVGNADRILDFSTAQTGTLFFVPTQEMLGDFAG